VNEKARIFILPKCEAFPVGCRLVKPLHRHRLFSTSDLSEGEDFASQIWERNRSLITDGDYGLRWSQVDIGKVGLAYIEHDCSVELKAQGPLSDHFRLFFHQGGSIAHSVHGRDFVSHADNAVSHSPGMDLCLDIRPFQLLLVSFDGDSVRTAMAQRFRKLPSPSDWVGVLPESASVQTLRSLTSWLATDIERQGSPLAEAGKPRKYAERLLLSLFVDCLSEAAPEASEVVEEISRAQVRKAQDWIDANLTEPIGVEDVATAIGVGARSLQISFRRVLGCTPHEFITLRRLELARQMLMSESAEQTVTAIATKLGFFELGRFSQRYRQHFGESPSETLGRRGRIAPHLSPLRGQNDRSGA
jgi:AraC-like DNA-binding protein